MQNCCNNMYATLMENSFIISLFFRNYQGRLITSYSLNFPLCTFLISKLHRLRSFHAKWMITFCRKFTPTRRENDIVKWAVKVNLKVELFLVRHSFSVLLFQHFTTHSDKLAKKSIKKIKKTRMSSVTTKNFTMCVIGMFRKIDAKRKTMRNQKHKQP